MKEIQLNNGKVALVDDYAFDWLNKRKWYAVKDKNTYYAVCSYEGKKVRMHRLILGLDGDISTLVDHIDHNGLNNQRSNLRTVTSAQNSFNRSPRENSASKYKGVFLRVSKIKDKTYKYWRAIIGVDGKNHSIGNFKNEDDAALAYNKKAVELYGEFAFLNEV